ncbi:MULTISPECIES: hypothetical protein [unclassified Variovorax]|uniref:hypothetical protein n=1 Tax=unclassified Variovorax TaxID=663243 RepID=UPI001BD3D09C|nr:MULTISPECIES: hypothetical protein [unclassified Variovorax]
MNLKARLRQVLAVGGIEMLGVVFAGIAGLLIVNVLPKDQYAQYTFLVAASNLMLGVSDLGLAHCVLPVIGTRAGEHSWVVGVCKQVFSWRWVMLTAGLLVVGPYWYVNSSGRGWLEPAYLVGTVLYFAIVLLQLREHYANSVAVVLGHISATNRIAAAALTTRLVLIGVVLLLPVTDWSVTGILGATTASGMVAVQLYRMALRKLGVPDVRLDAADRKKVDRQALKIVLPLLPAGIFLQVQGVATIFLASLFGSTDLLADVGAFGRLAIVLTVVDRVTVVLLFPALARAPAGPRLGRIVLRVHAAYLGAMALVLLSAVYGGHLWVMLLGAKYNNLEPYVWMVILSAILINASGFAFRTLAARGLTAKQHYTVPVIIAVQVLYFWLFGISDLVSVLGFGVATSLANFVAQYALLGARLSHLHADQDAAS